jgi:hypothetical protein
MTTAERDDAKVPYFDRSRLGMPEVVGVTCGVLLFLSLFLPWFSTGENPNSAIASAGIGPQDSANAWQVFGLLPWLLSLLALAPFILAWIVARSHVLGWPTGEVTMISGLTGVVLILCNGVILGKPDPGIEVSLSIGWFIGLLCSMGITVAGFLRQAQGAGRARKPPGVL